MKKAFSLTALLALCGLGVGVLASCQEIPAVYLGVEVEEHTHSYTGSVTKEATCTEEGVMTYTCSCGDTYTEAIPALGHDFTSIEYIFIEEEDDANGWYYVCSRCGAVGEALEDQESPLAGGEVVASTAEGLEAALSAANSATGEEVIITLTGDIEADGLEISGDNVTLTGEGELTLTDSIEVRGSDVTLDGLTIDATGVDEEGTGGSAAVKVTGDSTTISDCTIVGGGEGTYDASILVVSNEENGSEVDISGCDISGAYRGVFINGGKNVDLSISDCEIHSVYAFSKNGNDTGTTISVSNSKLYGWTSFAAVGEASFTDCVFGFSESEATTKVTGGFKPYSDVTLTGCYFSSFNTSGITLEGDQANDTKPYLAIESNNFGLAVGKDNVKITLISCTYEQSLDDGGVEVATVYEENVINLMYLDNFTTYSSSGFVFSLEDSTTVWTLGALTTAGYGVPTGGDEGGD